MAGSAANPGPVENDPERTSALHRSSRDNVPFLSTQSDAYFACCWIWT